MKKSMILAILLTVFLTSTSFGAQLGLVVNGDFEQGSTGWWSGGLFTLIATTSLSHSGSKAALFGSDGADGFIVQSAPIITVVGQEYDFSFWLQNDGGTPNDFSAYFGTNKVLGLVNAAAFGYTFYDYHVIADSTSTTLKFTGMNSPAFFRLDDVSVMAINGVHTPEPGTMVLLGGGLVGLAAYGRRRLKK